MRTLRLLSFLFSTLCLTLVLHPTLLLILAVYSATHEVKLPGEGLLFTVSRLASYSVSVKGTALSWALVAFVSALMSYKLVRRLRIE
ncbi:hypothetical protein [Pyrococcus yayanosii]|uniref:Uncharacterized protein n=1 Tax=Pyrococcus yayanosii (strain CH1 / JCM 16557) TaxID=529709 RepID=F8AFB2_PYRYC|nr:hypothetical protein [Pyrococcus yayanosii]AEH24945.1 hypothetical protein PYCH_12730 [Pyrococcus yayanosii CH1]